MIYFDVLPPLDAAAFQAALAECGILIDGDGATFRAVTHIGITEADVERVAEAISTLKA